MKIIKVNQYLLIITIVAFAVALGIFIQIFTNTVIEKEKENIIIQKRAKLVVLGNFLEHELDENLNRIIRLSNDPAFKEFSNTESLSSQILGVPKDLEPQKRNELQNVLSFSKSLSSMGLFLPSGDVYLAEPYSNQLNLQDRNFAFRDWYKGVINSMQPYVSEAYYTQYTNETTAAIAAPIIDDGYLVGIIHATFEFPFLINSLNDITLGNNVKIIIVDHYGKVALESTKMTSFDDMTVSFDGLSQNFDESSHLILQFDGQNFLILQSIISAGPNHWSVFLLQPYDDAFATVTDTQELSLIILISILTLLAAAGAVILYFIRKNLKIQQRLNDANQKLSTSLEKLKGIDVLKEEFSAMVTHELKTPLMPILGYCKMLKKPNMIGTLNEEQLEAVNVIEGNTKRLENLISDILYARKIGLKKLKFFPSDFSVKEIIDHVESNYKFTLEQNNIFFLITHNISKQTLHSDKNRILQVLDNLIGNAMKAVSPNTGKIEVGVNQLDSKINFYVKDNGIGMPKEKQKHLFQKFYQVDSSLTRKSEGSGLGLSICKGIVQGLGGKIWVESTEGNGSTFYFDIPMTKSAN